ncbi:MAG: hypothetical protein K6E77_02180 [Lachnospiraceae bacterium]|nr:hypothetical protein [Lachnospiraceae bacterium]
MRINDDNRPKEIRSNEIWELYKLLESLDEHYVFYDRCDAPRDKEELFYLARTELGDSGMIYENDNMGIQIPYSKKEWVELSLENIANGRKQKVTVKIEVNTLLKETLSVEELLEKKHIRIPREDELKDAEYEEIRYGTDKDFMIEKLPITRFPVVLISSYSKKRKDSERAAYWLESYLRSCAVPYKKDIDLGVTRFTFIFMCENAPGGFTEGCIWFFDKAAETRVYYNQMGADICRKSECRRDLLRLLNFINARVFMELNDGGNRWYDPQILYTPRMYLTEDDGYDISITTMLNYRFWKMAETETDDYITAYQPELLDKLAPFIFGVLRGELTTDEAILGIERVVLNEAE